MASLVSSGNKKTFRTVFQALVGLCTLTPFVLAAAGINAERVAWAAGVLAVTGAVTKVMNLPQVEAFLRLYAPFLAAGSPNLANETKVQEIITK